MSQSTTLPDWAVDHMNRYLATDGEDGHIWRGVPTLLLTTLGRSSGEQRMLPLIYGKDGDDHIIVASKGGHTDHPAWYLNLAASNAVSVQVAADKFCDGGSRRRRRSCAHLGHDGRDLATLYRIPREDGSIDSCCAFATQLRSRASQGSGCRHKNVATINNTTP